MKVKRGNRPNILHIVNTEVISLHQLLVDPVGLCGGGALVVCKICVLNSIQDIKRMGRVKGWFTFVHHLWVLDSVPVFLHML